MYLNKLKVVSKTLLLLATIVLLIYLIRENLNELRNYEFRFDIGQLIISFALLLVATLILPIIWHQITLNLKCNIGFKQSIRARLISEIGKYLPGRVFGYGYLIVHYKEAGQDQLKVFNSSIYELYLATFSSFFFFTIIHLFTSFALLDKYRLVFSILALVGILSLNPFFFQRMSDLLCRVFKKDKIAYKMSFSRSFGLLMMYICYWVVFSFAFFTFVNAFIEIHISFIFYLSGAYAISTFAGLLAFFLPAGLGAREGVLIYLLSNLHGNIIAIIISVSSRIWQILADLVLFFWALISDFVSKRNSLG